MAEAITVPKLGHTYWRNIVVKDTMLRVGSLDIYILSSFMIYDVKCQIQQSTECS
jgi:hypothetical protein